MWLKRTCWKSQTLRSRRIFHPSRSPPRMYCYKQCGRCVGSTRKILRSSQGVRAPRRRASGCKRWPTTTRFSLYGLPPVIPTIQQPWCVQRERYERFLQLWEICLRTSRTWAYLLFVRSASLWQRFRACFKTVEEGATKTELLEVEQMPLFYRREHDSHPHDPFLKHLRRAKVMKQAIHNCRKVLSLNAMLAGMCYDALGNMKSTHPGWTNQMFNISRHPQNERVYWTGSGAFSSKYLLCV